MFELVYLSEIGTMVTTTLIVMKNALWCVKECSSDGEYMLETHLRNHIIPLMEIFFSRQSYNIEYCQKSVKVV